MFMPLPAETHAISKKKFFKKYAVKSFYSNGGKMVFALLTKVIAGNMLIIFINVKKA